jgi:protocatechuate 3,4-dioxygenase beta subunit
VRRNNACLCLLFLTIPTAWGQTAAVAGTATNSLTGAPLPRVHVILRDPADAAASTYGALTTEDGKFSIQSIKPGTYVVTGSRIGFVMARGARLTLRLKAEDRNGDLRVQLTPTGAISGRVMDAEGEPLEGAAVTVDGSPLTNEFSTDESGRFRIGGLAPGKYRVRAKRESFYTPTISMRPEIRADGSVEVHNATTYYPGVLTAKQAGKVEVKPGEEMTDVDIRLVGVPFVRVSGRALAMRPGAGQPYADLRTPDSCCSGVMLNSEGRFEIWGLDPGKYTVSAHWEGAEGVETKIGRLALTAPVAFEVAGSNVDNLELRVVPNSDIAGRLVFETPDGTQPVAERKIVLGPEASAAVDADDTFQLKKISADRYVVRLSWDTMYVKSMQLGSQLIDGSVLDLSNGSGGAALTLLLSPASGSISGTVRDDKRNPAAARVVLVRDEETDGFPARYASTQKDGLYSFPNLPPGNYKLVAVSEDNADLIAPRPGGREPDLSDYEDTMETVEIRGAEKVSKDLKHQSGG